MENLRNICKKFNITKEEVINRAVFALVVNVMLFIFADKSSITFATAVPYLVTYFIMQPMQFSLVSFFFIKIPFIGKALDKGMRFTGKTGKFLREKVVELVIIIKAKMSK